MNKNIQVGTGNILLASQSYIGALDELKGTPYYNGDIKVLVDQLLNKIQNKFKKQLKYMFIEENAEVTLNLLKDYEAFNKLAVSEKALIHQMADYYKEDPDFWKENFVMVFDKLKSS